MKSIFELNEKKVPVVANDTLIITLVCKELKIVFYG